MLLRKSFILLLSFCSALSLAQSPAQGDAAKRWNITSECQMIVLSQKLALPLLPDLNDDTKIEAAFAKLQALIASGDAQLAANLVVKTRDEERGVSESVEELRYATEFDPPQLPPNAPDNLDVLKAWPIVGITPTAFETRNIGATLEVETLAIADGKAVKTQVASQHTRFLRWAETDAGTLANGKHLSVQQPIFYTIKNTCSLTLRNGQRVLLGVHKLKEPENTLELFLFKSTATPSP